MGKHFVRTTVFLLVLLWVYAAVNKLIDFTHFRQQMHNQVLPLFLQTVLIYLLLPFELATAALLLTDKTQRAGLYVSAILLTFFTGYIGLVTLKVFRKVPCSCGGILEHMGWLPHLFFNTFFLTITLTTIIIIKRKERHSIKSDANRMQLS
ncbi:MAG: hypothetical protein JWQ66_2105 [Mucilaginibacter sp.]|nr:hypothetical protein [Mucilaginibacter sp.]